MDTALIVIAIVLGVAAVILSAAILIIIKRNKTSQTPPAEIDLTAVEKTVEKSSRDTRDELTRAFANQMQTVLIGVNEIGKANKDTVEVLKAEVSKSLEEIRRNNDEKLEKMRGVVEEKLQKTISDRFSDSFNVINSSLTTVTKQLGEMQTLTNSVSDLNKMLSNVKARGMWGEVSLKNILDNILTKSQYEEQVAVKKGSAERVDFAVKLPGQGDGETVYLPIDSKFPSDDYIRLQEASERGDKAETERLRKELFNRIKSMALDIRNKYVNPPKTTDFAVIYFPTEGVYSEVAREPEMMAKLQELKILPAGPTIISALLNSLTIGFKTLQIQKKSAEIISSFRKIRKEMTTFDSTLAEVEKALETATGKVRKATDRSRILTGKIEKIELPDDDGSAMKEVAADGFGGFVGGSAGDE